MATILMLDTSVCVSLLRATPAALSTPARRRSMAGAAISSIVLAELETGVRKSRRPESHAELLACFCAQLAVLPFDAGAAREYGRIRAALEAAGTPIGPMDLLIAAHARNLGATLLTANLGEFRRVGGLRCEAWN